jgi:hypothetical protein
VNGTGKQLVVVVLHLPRSALLRWAAATAWSIPNKQPVRPQLVHEGRGNNTTPSQCGSTLCTMAMAMQSLDQMNWNVSREAGGLSLGSVIAPVPTPAADHLTATPNKAFWCIPV